MNYVFMPLSRRNSSAIATSSLQRSNGDGCVSSKLNLRALSRLKRASSSISRACSGFANLSCICQSDGAGILGIVTPPIIRGGNRVG